MSGKICPRCLSLADHSPDEKQCSDNCITRHQAEMIVIRTAMGALIAQWQDELHRETNAQRYTLLDRCAYELERIVEAR